MAGQKAPDGVEIGATTAHIQETEIPACILQETHGSDETGVTIEHIIKEVEVGGAQVQLWSHCRDLVPMRTGV